MQADIVSALGYMGIEACVIDVGGAALRGKVWGALKRAHVPDAMGKAILAAVTGVSAGPPGFSDLSGCLPGGRAFFFEVKAPAKLDPRTGTIITRAGEPSPDQLAFLDRMAARGALVGVVWSVMDAVSLVSAALRAAS